jgi:uncharacterized membrane protein YqhA
MKALIKPVLLAAKVVTLPVLALLIIALFFALMMIEFFLECVEDIAQGNETKGK